MNSRDRDLAPVCVVALGFTPQVPVGEKTGDFDVTGPNNLIALRAGATFLSGSEAIQQ
jgi:hypothetical protein